MTTVSTKSRLIEAAQAVIADEGWAAATTRRVADYAQVNPGLVHYHVGSIEQLRREALLAGIDSFFSGSIVALPEPDAPVGSWVRSLIDLDLDGPEQTRSARLLQESLVLAGRDAELRDRIATLLVTHRETIAGVLASRGVADPDGAASTISALVDGALLHRMLDPSLDLTPLLANVERMLGARHP